MQLIVIEKSLGFPVGVKVGGWKGEMEGGCRLSGGPTKVMTGKNGLTPSLQRTHTQPLLVIKEDFGLVV